MNQHSFTFNEDDNGGEQLILTTNFEVDEENRVWTEQTLTLGSYANSATLTLCGAAFTPSKLRKLADELDQVIDNIPGNNLAFHPDR